MNDKLIAIALTAQILSPTSHPTLVGNLHLTGTEEQVYIRQGLEVNDHLEESIRWVKEAREAQRELLQKWLAPIEARLMDGLFMKYDDRETIRQVARDMGIIELHRQKHAEKDREQERRRQERQRLRNNNTGVQYGAERQEVKWEEVERTWSTVVDDDTQGTEDK